MPRRIESESLTESDDSITELFSPPGDVAPKKRGPFAYKYVHLSPDK
jgi:hypothetical protein